MDRGNALQIYHLNLLKRWKEAVPAALTMVLQEREELGLDNKSKECGPVHLGPLWRPSLTVSETTGCQVVREIFQRVFQRDFSSCGCS